MECSDALVRFRPGKSWYVPGPILLMVTGQWSLFNQVQYLGSKMLEGQEQRQ